MTRAPTPTRLLAALAAALLACPGGDRPPAVPGSPGADEQGHSAPTPRTVATNAAVADDLPLDDAADFEAARRGLVARDDVVRVEGADGRAIWSSADYRFVKGAAPDSVNPSLWRQATLNGIHGLFEVTDGIHQVRGYDLSNLTLIEGDTGWILVDPLTAEETAAAALDLARRHLGERRVSAVILTHSHVDHFGGIASALDGAAPDVPIVAPAGFLHEATSENVLAGVAMLRRAAFMYGFPLARSPRGHVDTGLGRQPASGTAGLRAPTILIDSTPQELVLDGVRFQFQYAPETEAPAELTFYLPDRKAYCGAEVVSRTMHNVYTLRGAKVRDALRWSNAIDEALELFGRDAEVAFASHHWPTWGNANVVAYLEGQRDIYKFVHDQTLRLANAGYTPNEIAGMLELPETLAASFANRGYYGTLRHNAKAVYQWYFGWYDGNPANLDPLAPEEAGAHYVEAMGGAAEVRRKAGEAFDRGEVRWAATMLNHLVFAEPGDGEARELLARCYDQLGYRAESGPWRDVYLTGAFELRHGHAETASTLARSLGLLRHVPVARFFDAMAARVDAEKAEGERIKLNFVFTDLGESHVLEVANSVLHHRQREPDPGADATVRLTHEFFLGLVVGDVGLRDAIFGDALDLDGSRTAVLSFFSLLERPNDAFPVVTP